MSNLLSRRLVALAVAGAITTLAAPAAAQTPAEEPLRLPRSAQVQPNEPTIQLSIQDAVDMALRYNLGLEASQLDIDVADYSIASARAAFLPQVQSTFNGTRSTSVPFNFTEGSANIQSRGGSFSAGFGQNVPWLGGNYSVSWSGSRNSTKGGNSSFNPRLNSTFRVNFTQPLLNGFRTDGIRMNLETSQRQRAITDIRVQQNIVATEAVVELAYLSLLAAIENQKVVQGNMDIRQQALDNARARVAVGTAPQIDIIQAEADVATNREQLINAEVGIYQAEDVLRTLILDPSRPDYWTVRLVPTDTVDLEERTIDVDAAIQNALANRLDLEVQRRSLEITDLSIELSKNSTLPNVDLNVNYAAQGTGGTQLQFGSGFPPPVIGETNKSFGSVLNDTFLGAFPAWTVAVTVGYPVGQTAAKANYASAQVQKRQQEIALRQTELRIVQEVRDAGRAVESALQRIQATQAGLDASQQNFEAENRRFNVGLSTTLDLQTRQQQLATARVSALNARIAYARALIVFDRVQKTN